jgi:hypothetical protein
MPLKVYRKVSLRFDKEFEEADQLAKLLLKLLESEAMRTQIAKVHQLGSTSQAIQALLNDDLQKLGFHHEKSGLFANMTVSALRPDFYRPVGRTGIIAEVERGKTITNNMDLLDVWKTHICSVASFLFLIVPMDRKSENGISIKAYDHASRRLATFFEPENYINVDALFLFGY